MAVEFVNINREETPRPCDHKGLSVEIINVHPKRAAKEETCLENQTLNRFLSGRANTHGWVHT